jgi:D-galacturonate reductase
LDNLKNILIIGNGEYVTGYTNVQNSTSDKKKGVILLSLLELKRLGLIGEITICGTNVKKYQAIKEHINVSLKEYSVYTEFIDKICWFNNPDNTNINSNLYIDAVNSMREYDIVIISTPDNTHFDIAKTCVEKKMHVLVTKPLVKELNHHYELLELANKYKVIVATEMHKRWDPMYIDAILEAKDLGNFSYFESYMSQPDYQLDVFDWAKTGDSDISYYLNSHHIDYHLLLLKNTNSTFKPVSVMAHGTKRNSNNFYDTITLTVKYLNIKGDISQAIYTSSWIAPKSDVHSKQEFFYMGTGGEIKINQAQRGYTVNKKLSNGIGHNLQNKNPLFFNYKNNGGYVDLSNCYGFKSIKAFINCVNKQNDYNTRTDLVAQINDTTLVTAILEAGSKSLKSGKQIYLIEDNDRIRLSDNNICDTYYDKNNYIYYPNDTDQIKNIIGYHKKYKIPLKCIGSGLSPNGVAIGEHMINLRRMNKIIVDKDNKTFTAEAGATIAEILNELDKYNLTLSVLGSITDQSIVGFIQTGSHGTGSDIGPIDKYVKEFKILTLNNELITIDSKHEYFNYVKCGLGYFGVITEITLECIDRLFLIETIEIIKSNKIKHDHVNRLKDNKYLKYLHMPYTNKVIVSKINETEQLTDTLETKPTNRDLSLLLNDPLNIKIIKTANNKEIDEFSNISIRYGYNRDILTFNCGPKQLVYEVAIPVIEYEDITFVEDLMDIIKHKNIPAHGPIEQRWSTQSNSYLSPVYDTKEQIFSWIGIIMYLTEDDKKNLIIKQTFQKYVDLFVELSKKYNGKFHLGKIKENDYNDIQFKSIINCSEKSNDFILTKDKLDRNKLFKVEILDNLYDNLKKNKYEQKNLEKKRKIDESKSEINKKVKNE